MGELHKRVCAHARWGTDRNRGTADPDVGLRIVCDDAVQHGKVGPRLRPHATVRAAVELATLELRERLIRDNLGSPRGSGIAPESRP